MANEYVRALGLQSLGKPSDMRDSDVSCLSYPVVAVARGEFDVVGLEAQLQNSRLGNLVYIFRFICSYTDGVYYDQCHCRCVCVRFEP